MGKYANKPQGKPTKRKTLKVKYKIERKVKQHNKRVRKEAIKLKAKGLLRSRDTSKDDFLPNMFPYKMQLLDEQKRGTPQSKVIETNVLEQTPYGLINLENKCVYLPKPKDNLIKKYVTNLEHTLANTQIVLEILDSKNPKICIDNDFRESCRKHNVTVISILSRSDKVSHAHLATSLKFVKKHCETVVTFSCDTKRREQSTSDLMTALKQTKGGTILVAGKLLTGKHSLITTMAKATKCYSQNPCELQVFKIDPAFKLLDSPYKIEDKSGHPIFYLPNPILEEGLQAQEQNLLRRLFVGQGREKALFDRDAVLEQYEIQDYTSVSDFIAKTGRASRFFGKGGSIDTARVRTKVLTDWFCGKLNYFLA